MKNDHEIENHKINFIKCDSESDLKKIYSYDVDAFALAGDFEWSMQNLLNEQKQGWEIYSVVRGNEIISALFVKKEQNSLLTKNTPIKISYQGKGYSHLIKEFYESKAKSLKASRILNYCAVDNFRNIALNESHGYKKVAVLHNGEVLEFEKKVQK